MFNDTNREFNKTIHQKKLLANYKTSAEQWKKLYEEEHKKLFQIQNLFDKFDKGDIDSYSLALALSPILKKPQTCKHGTPIDMECTRCLTDSELLLD